MNKSPDLKLRYAIGLGDIIACFLHSRYVGWLTKLITGKDAPCTKCSQRRTALNILFRIPVWKLFFKNEEDVIETLAAEYRGLGYTVKISEDKKNLSVSRPITSKN